MPLKSPGAPLLRWAQVGFGSAAPPGAERRRFAIPVHDLINTKPTAVGRWLDQYGGKNGGA